MCSINPKVDIVFRKLFASQGNEEILKALVSTIIEERLGEFKLNNCYSIEKYINNELDIISISAEEINHSIQYDISLLFELEKVYFEKHLTNLLNSYINDRILENNYKQGRKTILININDFSYINKTDYYNSYTLYNIKSNKRFNQLVEVHFLDLSQFNKKPKELSTAIERWVYFLNNGYKIDDAICEQFRENKFLLRAVDKLRSMNLDNAEYEIYDGQLGYLRDKVSALEEGQRRVAERVKRDIAKNLLTTNIGLINIAKATELTIEQVSELIDNRE